MSISLCMIVKNEAETLQQVLNHHKDFVSEIIVVDTGSTDNTKQIAQNCGAKVFDFDWCDDFSAARNESLKHATSDWILILDADELISTEQMISVAELQLRDKKTCYLFTQRHYTNNSDRLNFKKCSGESKFERGIGYYESKVSRFFPRDEKLFFSHCIHELIETQAEKEAYKIAQTNIVIHHYGNIENEKSLDKTKFYLRLAQKKIEQEPTNSKAFYELGVLYNIIGDKVSASRMFDESYSISTIDKI